MISPQFYTKSNRQKVVGKPLLLRFPHKPRAVVVTKYAYSLSYGENMYTLAEKLFGKERQYMWTIIADMNEPRMPDEWEAGEVVYLPEIIVQEPSISET
jgi:hypothetical protein